MNKLIYYLCIAIQLLNCAISFAEEQESLVFESALTRMSDESLKATTLYTPDGAVLKPLQDEIDMESIVKNNNTIVIGNGGAGYVGLIKHLAKAYNRSANQEDQITVGWKFADSHMNFKSILSGTDSGESCDLYITYEPLKELELHEQSLVQEIIRLFNDEFPIIGPCSNPAELSPYADPVENMGKIITYALGLEDRNKPVYFSRWNHSAMGVKDQQLWCKGVDRVAKKMINLERADWVIPNIEEKILIKIQSLIESDEIEYKQKKRLIGDVLLKEFTDHHVFKPKGRVFPAGAISATMEEGLYGITDGALIVQHDIEEYDGYRPEDFGSCKIYNRADKGSVDHILTNPAQLLIPNSFDEFPDDSPQNKFLDWLKSSKGHETISNFKLKSKKSEKRSPYQGHVKQISLNFAFEANRSTNVYIARVGVVD